MAKKTDSKSNEITAILALLEFLSIKRCPVSIDGIGCQREIAEKIIAKEADYLLSVKGSQPKHHEAFQKHLPMSQILKNGLAINNLRLSRLQPAGRGLMR